MCVYAERIVKENAKEENCMGMMEIHKDKYVH
jgi:hypothetical protein